jgi:hypothetical protein
MDQRPHLLLGPPYCSLNAAQHVIPKSLVNSGAVRHIQRILIAIQQALICYVSVVWQLFVFINLNYCPRMD